MNTTTSIIPAVAVTAAVLSPVDTNLADNSYISAATVPVATEEAISANSTVTFNLLAHVAGDPEHVVRFKVAVAAALVNPDFIRDGKKCDKATNLITPTDLEIRVRAQLLSNAEKTLYAKAAKSAEKGEPFVPPTKAEIETKVEEGLKAWRAKQAN